MQQWSKLKKRVEAFFTDDAKKRVKLFSTRYRWSHDQVGECWVVADGVKIFSAGTLHAWSEEFQLASGLQQINKCENYADPKQYAGYHRTTKQAKEILQKQGIYTQYEFYEAIEKYINLSIEEAMLSDNIIIKALSMIDKRLGQRRLNKIILNDNAHPLVKQLFQLRTSKTQQKNDQSQLNNDLVWQLSFAYIILFYLVANKPQLYGIPRIQNF